MQTNYCVPIWAQLPAQSSDLYRAKPAAAWPQTESGLPHCTWPWGLEGNLYHHKDQDGHVTPTCLVLRCLGPPPPLILQSKRHRRTWTMSS